MLKKYFDLKLIFENCAASTVNIRFENYLKLKPVALALRIHYHCLINGEIQPADIQQT